MDAPEAGGPDRPRPLTGGLLLGLAAWVGLLGACPGAPVIEQRPAAEIEAVGPPVRPRFDWPATLELTVSREARRAETVSGEVRRLAAPVEQWQWTFRRQGERGLLQMTGEPSAVAGSLELTEEGRVVRTEGLTGAERGVVMQLWAQLILLWNGKELEAGQAYRRPVGEGEEGPKMQLLLRKVGECPTAREGGGRCAWLENLVALDADHFRDLGTSAAEAFLQGVREALPELSELPIRIVSVHPERQSELVTEIDTLIPRSFTERTYLRVEVAAGEEGDPIVSEIIEETRWTFEPSPDA